MADLQQSHGDDLVRIVLSRLNSQDDVLHQQNKLLEDIRRNTNGRLRNIELWQARVDGAKAAFHWVPALVAGLLGAGLTAVVTVVLTHA